MEKLPKQFYYKRNRLQQLKGFYYTAQLGNISKAAEEMGLTQSSVTLQIQSLERDLNVKLFHHENKKRFALTEAGEKLYSRAAPIIQTVDGLYEKFILGHKTQKENKIDIAAHHISISYLLPQFLKEYNDKYPDVKITIRNISRDEALKRLNKDEIDIMVYPTVEVPDECYFKPTFIYKPTLIMHKDHPLATWKDEDITFEELAKHKLIRIDSKLIILPTFEEAVKYYGIGSNISFENGDWSMLKKFVKQNMGLALVSNLCIEETDTTIVGKSLKKILPMIKYGIMVKKGKFIIPQVKNFIDIMDRDFFKK